MTMNRNAAAQPQGPGRPQRTRILWGAGAVAAVGAAAAGVLVATSGAPTAAPAQANLSAAHLVAAQPAAGRSAPAKGAPAAKDCDTGKWTGADASVQGRPEDFAAGETGRTYVWHDDKGWHLRTTDATKDAHHYSGTITASPGAHFVDVAKIKLEKDDVLTVDDHNVLHYSFTTFQGIDGVNFRVSSCDVDHSHESLTFHLQKNGEDDNLANVALGSDQHHPDADPFTVRRTV